MTAAKHFSEWKLVQTHPMKKFREYKQYVTNRPNQLNSDKCMIGLTNITARNA